MPVYILALCQKSDIIFFTVAFKKTYKNDVLLRGYSPWEIALLCFISYYRSNFLTKDLNISTSELAETTKTYFNKTFTDLISERIVIKAKPELYLNNKAIKEISGELSYQTNTNLIVSLNQMPTFLRNCIVTQLIFEDQPNK